MLELHTGCRLHFGLLELAENQPHRFGGLGLMLQSPRVRVRLHKGSLQTDSSDDVEIARRAQLALMRAISYRSPPPVDAWTVEVLEHPALHSGLGLGTQLAAAVSTAVKLTTEAESPAHSSLGSWHTMGATPDRFDLSLLSELATSSGRGKRSAIGLHGFLFGGLIQDLGYDTGESSHSISAPTVESRPVATRSVTFPRDWRVVLVTSTVAEAMHGQVEEDLISAAAGLGNPSSQWMLELSNQCMAAASTNDFDGFAHALEGYMQYAGELFYSVQKGRYRNQTIADRVELASRAGLRGVGQSSWGPTVFGFARDEGTAQTALDSLQQQLHDDAVEVIITRAADRGAQWRWSLSGVQHAG